VPDLPEALTEIIWDPDRRFEQVKLFCIAELSRIADPRVVEALIRIVTHENVDRTVYARAAETLVDRVDPGSVPGLAAALARRTDYLLAKKARGVDALARAAAKLRARDLAQPLVAHLLDAETPAGALQSIVEALVAIGEPSAVEPLAQFLLDYRADESMEAHPEALRAAADGLVRLGGPVHRQLLKFIQGDAHTRPFLRAYVEEVLSAAPPGRTGGAGGARGGTG
jgi:HEAT repeat protein